MSFFWFSFLYPGPGSYIGDRNGGKGWGLGRGRSMFVSVFWWFIHSLFCLILDIFFLNLFARLVMGGYSEGMSMAWYDMAPRLTLVLDMIYT